MSHSEGGWYGKSRLQVRSKWLRLSIATCIGLRSCRISHRPSLFTTCSKKARPLRSPAELAKASRVDTNGWINVHLEGTPREIGFQHGWLLATEIDDLLKALRHFLEGSTKRDWAFFRSSAERMFWPKLEAEYQEEIDGIVEGA